MLWKCWNTLTPSNVHEIEADNLDVACKKAREIDPDVDAFKPKGDENND